MRDCTRIFFIVIYSCLLLHFLNAQNLQKTDSLELSLEVSSNLKDKVETLLLLSDQVKNNDPYKAIEYAEKAYLLAESEDYAKGTLNSLISQAYIYWGITDFKKSMEIR